MTKKFYTSIPMNYAVCLHHDCPKAATCLHQIAYQTLVEQKNYLNLINPNRCGKDDSCRYYRDNTPVVYARGFTNFQKRMFPDQYQTFKSILTEKFGRNPYFERRNGKTMLSPKEQEFVLQALKKAGITEEFQFDGYEENYNWHD